MKIIYAANIRLPSERAHGIQIVNTCSALARIGAEVTLAVPSACLDKAEDPFAYYGITANFKIVGVKSVAPEWKRFPKVAYLLRALVFMVGVAFFFGKELRSGAVLYGREETVLAPLSFLATTVFWETHLGHSNVLSRMLMRKARGIVCITKGLADKYVSMGVPQNKLRVAPDAVDVVKFDSVTESREILRKKLSLPEDVIIATYNGSIGQYSWKGVDTFLESVQFIQEARVRFLVTGGRPEEVALLKAKYPDQRILFKGRISSSEVPMYLKASDILVLPNKAGNEVSERYTSPMKLFEYMAARRPIIASDLPSIREVLDGSSAAFFRAGDAKGLAEAIQGLVADPVRAEALANASYSLAGKYTWRARGESVGSFIRACTEK